MCCLILYVCRKVIAKRMMTISTTTVQLRVWRNKASVSTFRSPIVNFHCITHIGKSINNLSNLRSVTINAPDLKSVPIDLNKLSRLKYVYFSLNDNNVKIPIKYTDIRIQKTTTFPGIPRHIKKYTTDWGEIHEYYDHHKHSDYKYEEGGTLSCIEIYRNK